MTEKTIPISVPLDLYAELENVSSPGGNLGQKLRQDLAIGMFISKKVSLSRAAEYVGMPLYDFSELLRGLGVSVASYTEDMLADDLAFAENMQT